VARAVHHAHQRGILYRDLKPGNILLDRSNEPKLADWGIAKRLDGSDGLTTTDSVIGTAEYMAPESGQAPLTTAADVYSLAVVLYEVLTGVVPFRGASPVETLRLKDQGEAPPPSADLVLSRICLKGLERNPDDRYASASLLADDLDAWLQGRTTSVRSEPWSRLRRSIRRHPALAGLSALAAALLALVAVAGARQFAETRVAGIREEARANELGYTASAVSDRLLMRLKDWAAAIVEAANDPELPARLQADDRVALRSFLKSTWDRMDAPSRGLVAPGKASPFDSWFLFNDRGIMVAYPLERSLEGKDFSGREWFHGGFAQRGRRGLDSIHVSRVFQSVVTPDLYKFTVSAPVYAGGAPDAPVVGVIGASFTTDIDLGDERHKVVLAGPWDPVSEGPHSAGDYLILMHPAHARGRPALKAPILGVEPDPLREQLRSQERKAVVDLNYLDPFAPRDPAYAGRWWAGLAPVGNTRFLAIVQRRPEEPAPGGALFLGVSLSLFLGVVGILIALLLRMRASSRPKGGS
jgi:serine/threonine-protein kinase